MEDGHLHQSHPEIAKRLKMVKPDACSVKLAKDQKLAEPAPGGAEQKAAIEIGWLEPGERKTVKWLVEGAGTLTLGVGSTRAGVATRELTLGP